MVKTIYFETMASAIEHALLVADSERAVLYSQQQVWDELSSDPLNYEETRCRSFELETYKGRGTRRWFHVQLHRMPSGRYELNTYVL